MTAFRTETDLLGPRHVPADALHGIHTERAVENFPLSGRPVHPALVQAYGAVKLACARANRELGCGDDRIFEAIERACAEMIRGDLAGAVIVDALQGGAGTSTNMNVNEVLANRALQIMGEQPGAYRVISPLDDINRHQSTNDTFPTALRVAAMQALRPLETEIVLLQEAFQDRERALDHVVKVGRTQFQDAVLVTMGREMGAYAEAVARDRWRIHKCVERLRVVNLGGTAVGTGLGAPRQFIFRVVDHLREITGLSLARGENLMDATQNADAFVEVGGMLASCAATLMKIATDLRFLSSGPEAGIGEIRLPPRQAGSSLMPGKVNPVIPEAVTQASLVVIANNGALTHACGLGSLDLNPFLPLVADLLLTNITLLQGACGILNRFCVAGLEADEARCRRQVDTATATVTALVEEIGYDAAEALAAEARGTGMSIRMLAIERGLLSEERFDRLTSPESVTKLGWATPPVEPERTP